MGHIRLKNLSRTRKWREVVELIAVGADVPQVAAATIKAAESAFSFVTDDIGYNQAVWLLTQLGLAGEQGSPIAYLSSQGVIISENASVPGVALALTEALDAYCHSAPVGRHSDLGDLAQRALIDAVTRRLEPKMSQQPLFSMPSAEINRALSEFRKPNEFGRLSREFYSRLTSECMNYFLSQTLATHLGDGQRFPTTNQMAEFERALAKHCHEASAIVEQFSNEWFSKHRFEEQRQISRESIQGFASYALKKMKDELKAGAQSDEQ